jgi:hypothetical protein
MKTKIKLKLIAYLTLIVVGSIALALGSIKNSDKQFIAGTGILIIGIVLFSAEISSNVETTKIIAYNQGLTDGYKNGSLERVALFESEEKFNQADKEIKRIASIILIRDERSGLYNIVAKNRWGSEGKIFSNGWSRKN